MTDSSGTYTRSIVVDLPDDGSGTVTFKLKSSVAINSVAEVFPVDEYTLTLDANGEGTIALPCPDNTGDDAWQWHVTFPGESGAKGSFTLAYDAASVELGTLLSAAAATTTANALTALLDDYLPRDAGIVSKNGAYTMAAGDDGKIIECDGTFTLTLPDGLDDGFQVTVINVGTGTITLSAATTLQSADSATTIATQYKGAAVYHRGSNVWLAMGGLE